LELLKLLQKPTWHRMQQFACHVSQPGDLNSCAFAAADQTLVVGFYCCVLHGQKAAPTWHNSQD
jgi:hypothetical protein